MESVASTAIATSVIGAVFGSLLSEPSGPTPEQIEAQRKADEEARILAEKKRLDFLRSKTDLTGKLKGSGTAYSMDNDVGSTEGLKLKSVVPVPAVVSPPEGAHGDFFGQSGSAKPTVELLREPVLSQGGSGLLDPAEFRKAVSNPDLTQEERERLYLRTKVKPVNLSDHPMVDSRAFVEKERYTDPYLDIAAAAAKGGAASVEVSMTEEGGKKVLEVFGGKTKGFDAVLALGKTGVETPKTTAEKVVAVGDYALTYAPSWSTAVDAGVNAVGAGTRQAVVRYWASHDNSAQWDPRPMETAQKKYDSWYDDQNQWTKAALDRVGAGGD